MDSTEMKPLVVSFSGGRTSGYMTKHLIDIYRETRQIIVLFANTGEEHEKTLEFVNSCDKEFGFNTIWLEAVVYHGERKGNGWKEVNYKTASRNGEPYEEIIKKHGIPNHSFPHCTRELKLAPIKSYLNSIGFKLSDVDMAIGIRADETRRVRKDAIEAGIVYPLVEWGVDKQDVLDWWSEQSFDLDIKEHEGNCKWCWKKSDKKLFKNIMKHPEWFDFPRTMEERYARVGPEFKKEVPTDKRNSRVFFRGNTSTIQLFKKYELAQGNLLPVSNIESGGCSESCEFLPTE